MGSKGALGEGLGWMCSSWGEQVGCAGDVGSGEGSRERLGGRMTLFTPCCFAEGTPAPGGLLEIK